MSTDIVKYGFIAGEISPSLYGRTDLTKYDLAVAEAQNFFVDYRGGLSSRPGTQFIDIARASNKPTRTFVFAFATDISNNYVLLFGDRYIRFYQDGGIVLDEFDVRYEVVTPFAGEDLKDLVIEQYRDLLRITSSKFPVYNLIRHDHANWELVVEEISPFIAGVDITAGTASATGTAQTVFAVTKVLADGTESSVGAPFRLSGVINYVAQEGSVSVTWPASADAAYYNVYRSVVSVGEILLEGAELGYVGRTHGTKFTDPNIIPDFTRVPPTHSNPFTPGRIEKIELSNGGSGYTAFATTVDVTGSTGSGFVGQCVVDDSGAIVNVIIKCAGEGYSNPVVSFTGTGSGAVATATVSPLVGTYPTLSEIFQQRQIYAASLNDPISVWGSRIKQFSNFSASDFVLDDDAFEFTLDSRAIVPIEHLLVTRGGLLCMTQKDIWLLNGGGSNEPLTPTNALAEPQSYTGVSKLKPIPLGNDLLFAEGKGHAIRMLTYNEIYRSYTSEDRSILSAHLFGPGKDIIRWAYQESPYKVTWAVREDGALLAFTSVKTEEVYAWTPCSTQGKFLDVVVVQEGTEDRVYLTVERNGTKYIERMDLRQYENVEDAWCVDCGLSLPATYPNGTLTIFRDAETDVYSATSSLDLTIGAFIRGANGIFKVIDGKALEVYAEPTNWVPETNRTKTFTLQSGEWTMDEPVETLGGLSHLEGQTVAILADGNVFPNQKVKAGEITLPVGVTRAIVGLPFTCRAKTLPIVLPQTSIESKRKRIVGIGVRLDKSRGIKLGPTLDRLAPMRERTNEPLGHPIKLINGMKYQLIYSDWNEDGQTYFVQSDPLPCNILSIVSDIEVGDEPD